jgi:serine/threonine-protein kinase
VLGLGTYFVVRMTRGGGGSTKLPLKKPTENKPPNTKPTETQPASTVKAEMVALPGGTFLMGREKGLPQETPAHSMTVAPFWMDRTEVTNSEYSQFVSETNYKAPASWSNNQPPQGQEQWPVSNVSFEDATAFAAWRSKRDGVTYRLPTEEEWEYAARSGADDDLYPWGNAWKDEYANLGTKVVKPAGSFPAGKNKWGNLDLIGNVWEWTSSKIALYPGNHNEIPVEQRSWIVIRGGSYSSDATGPKAVTTVTRQWVEPSRRDALLGIRLVRSGS